MEFPLVLALAVGLTGVDDAKIRVVDALVSGDPMVAAFGVDPDAIHVGEGAELITLTREVEGPLAIKGRARLPGCPIEVEVTHFGVFAACGRQGLAVVEPGAMESRTLWDPPGRVCTDVTSDGVHGFALFSGPDLHEVLVFDLATRALVRRMQAEGGRAFALATSGGDVYVARGKEGVSAHTGVLPPGAEVKTRTLARVPLIDARDVAVARGVLWIAGGPTGLVDVRLHGEYLPRRHPIVVEGRRRVAVRVSADGPGLAVATQSIDVAITDGQPYGHLGPFGIDLSPGAVDEAVLARPAERDIVRLYRIVGRRAAAFLDHDVEVSGGAFRTLEMKGDELLMQRMGEGLSLANLGGTVIVRRGSSFGISPIDGSPVPGEDRVIVGFDELGGRSAGSLSVSSNGALRRGEIATADEHNGQMFDAAWRGTNGEAMVVVGGWFSPSIVRPRSGRRVTLALPPDADGRLGHTYIHSAMVGPEHVAISRVGAATGLLIYRTADLERHGEGDFAAVPVASADTSGGAALELWRTAAFPRPGGTWLLVSAAGRSADDRARVLGHTFDGRDLERVFEWSGPAEGTSAIGVSDHKIGEHPIAFVTSLGGTVDAIDVGDPRAPRRLGHLELGADPWDGSHLAATDCLVLPGRGSAPAQLLIACGRAGLTRIPLPGKLNGNGLALAVGERVELPGWTIGLVGLGNGGRFLACCQKGGAVLLELTDGGSR